MSHRRLDLGELRPPAAGGRPSADAALMRSVFLSSLSELEPSVWRSLRANVLPLFPFRANLPDVLQHDQAIWPTLDRLSIPPTPFTNAPGGHWREWLTEEEAEELDEQMDLEGDDTEAVIQGRLRAVRLECVDRQIEFLRRLETWSDDWHLPDGWLIRAAVQKMRLWRLEEVEDFYPHINRDEEDWGLCVGPSSGGTLRPALPEPQLGPWDPRYVSKRNYINSAIDELNRYVHQVEKLARQKGWESPHHRRPQGNDHFAWLVRYQVSGWSHQGIADHDNVGRSTVLKAVKKLAEQIGLTLRPPPAN